MTLTGISISLLIIVGLVYVFIGKRFDKSSISMNLDLKMAGLLRALGVLVVCIGLLNMMSDYGRFTSHAFENKSNNDILSSDIGTNEIEENLENNASIYNDGIFTGSGRGFKSTIKMQVTVSGGVITHVEVLEHKDDRKWFNRANRVVPQYIIDAQSANVVTVSGATYTSLGMIDGAEEALSKSRGE